MCLGCKDFKDNLSKRVSFKLEEVVLRPYLNNFEIERATVVIVKIIQKCEFHDLYYELDASSEQSINCKIVNKQLAKLHPFMHDGIIRVGGRLQRFSSSFDAKHQKLLPSKHPVTDLIIHHYHSLSGHSGTMHVLSAVREKFWILKGHATVKRVLSNCRECRRWKAKVGEQLMSPLPEFRVNPCN